MDGVSRTSVGGKVKSQNLEASVKDAFCCGRPKREQAPLARDEDCSDADLWKSEFSSHFGFFHRNTIDDFDGVISALKEKDCGAFKEALERLTDIQISKFSKYMDQGNAWAQIALINMLQAPETDEKKELLQTLVAYADRGPLGGIRARNRDVFNGEVVRNVFESLDRNFLLEVLSQDCRAWQYVSDKRADFEFIRRIREHHPEVLQSANKSFVLAAVGQIGDVLEHASDGLKGDREIVLAAVAQDGRAFQYASEELRGDREIVLAAVAQDGRAFQYASEELRGDREIVLAAVQQNGSALKYAAAELTADREIVLAAVQEDGYALAAAAAELKGDREIVLAAVQQDGYALAAAAAELKGDREFVLAAVQQNGYALAAAAAELKGDREIVLAAVQQNGYALAAAAAELKGDREIVLAAVAQDGFAFPYASDELKGDREFVKVAVGQDGNVLKFVSVQLRGEREIVLAAVAQDWAALDYASDELKGDREIILAAVAQNGNALKNVSKDLRGDKEVVLAAVGQNGNALKYVSEDLKGDREVVLAAVGQAGAALRFASDELKEDREVVLAAVAQAGAALRFTSDELKGDREVVLAAVAQDGAALKYITAELKSDLEIRKTAIRSIAGLKRSKIDVSGTLKVVNLNTEDLIDTLTEKYRRSQSVSINSSDLMSMRNFYIQSLTFLDLNNSENTSFSLAWLYRMKDIMRLDVVQKQVFDDFVDLATGMSIQSMSIQRDGLYLSSESLVNQLWEEPSHELLFSPYTPGHFLYVHAKKMTANEVVFTVGNTGRGVQGKTLHGSSSKADLLQRYTVTREMKNGQKEDDDCFKERLILMTEQLQQSQKSDGANCNADVFMTEILPDVFKGIEAERDFEKRRVQRVGNCAGKGIYKNLFYQVCLDRGCPDLYYAITDKMSEVLWDVFQGEGNDLEKVRDRITKKRAKLADKISKSK